MTLQGISDLSEVLTKHSQSSRQAISISPVGLFAEYYQYVVGGGRYVATEEEFAIKRQ